MEAKFEVIIERCCGLDVHQETVVACVLIGAPGERPSKEIRTFRTMTRDLKALRDWLQELGVTQVGMESTGVYWRPIYAVLRRCFELIFPPDRDPWACARLSTTRDTTPSPQSNPDG